MNHFFHLVVIFLLMMVTTQAYEWSLITTNQDYLKEYQTVLDLMRSTREEMHVSYWNVKAILEELTRNELTPEQMDHLQRKQNITYEWDSVYTHLELLLDLVSPSFDFIVVKENNLIGDPKNERYHRKIVHKLDDYCIPAGDIISSFDVSIHRNKEIENLSISCAAVMKELPSCSHHPSRSKTRLSICNPNDKS